jgi:AI-2 transport protein TqsA
MDDATTDIAASLVIVFLVLTASYLAQTVLEPVVFAIFIIALVWPMQRAFQSRMPKPLALFVTILVTLTAIIALSSLVVWGVGAIADWIGQNLARIKTAFESTTQWLEEHDIFVVALATEHFNTAWLVGLLQAAALRANIIVGFALLVFIYVVMGLGEIAGLHKKIAALNSEATSRRLLLASEQTANKFRKYMLVRTIASVATGLLVWAFALAIGLDLATPWGVLAFALNYLPYIGPLIVTVLPPLFAFVQFGSGDMAIFVLLGLIAIQFTIGSYVEPIFSGSALAISPFVVVFAVLLWTFLWGVPGAFIGVPIAIAFLTFCDNFPSTRKIAALLSGDAPKESDG